MYCDLLEEFPNNVSLGCMSISYCPYVQISANWFLTVYRLLPMIYDSRLAVYLYHVELPNSAARGAAVMPSSTNLHTNMLSVSIGAHKYAACFYWRPPSSYLCAQQHKFTHKYVECFYWRPQICCMFLLAPTVKLSLCPAAQI
jgi:hypothetical protein